MQEVGDWVVAMRWKTALVFEGGVNSSENLSGLSVILQDVVLEAFTQFWKAPVAKAEVALLSSDANFSEPSPGVAEAANMPTSLGVAYVSGGQDTQTPFGVANVSGGQHTQSYDELFQQLKGAWIDLQYLQVPRPPQLDEARSQRLGLALSELMRLAWVEVLNGVDEPPSWRREDLLEDVSVNSLELYCASQAAGLCEDLLEASADLQQEVEEDADSGNISFAGQPLPGVTLAVVLLLLVLTMVTLGVFHQRLRKFWTACCLKSPCVNGLPRPSKSRKRRKLQEQPDSEMAAGVSDPGCGDRSARSIAQPGPQFDGQCKDTACSFCLKEVAPLDKCALMPCRMHRLHWPCWEEWRLEHEQCPVCHCAAPASEVLSLLGFQLLAAESDFEVGAVQPTECGSSSATSTSVPSAASAAVTTATVFGSGAAVEEPGTHHQTPPGSDGLPSSALSTPDRRSVDTELVRLLAPEQALSRISFGSPIGPAHLGNPLWEGSVLPSLPAGADYLDAERPKRPKRRKSRSSREGERTSHSKQRSSKDGSEEPRRSRRSRRREASDARRRDCQSDDPAELGPPKGDAIESGSAIVHFSMS